MTAPHVAIIDDDAPLRKAMMSLVRSAGYDVSGHPSAEAFIGSRNLDGAACIITDVQMPGMSGLELKSHLDHLFIRTPVIMVTARTEQELQDRAVESGATCLLRKPFEAQDLMSCLNKAMLGRA